MAGRACYGVVTLSTIRRPELEGRGLPSCRDGAQSTPPALILGLGNSDSTVLVGNGHPIL